MTKEAGETHGGWPSGWTAFLVISVLILGLAAAGRRLLRFVSPALAVEVKWNIHPGEFFGSRLVAGFDGKRDPSEAGKALHERKGDPWDDISYDPWGNMWRVGSGPALFYSLGPNRIDELGKGDDIYRPTSSSFVGFLFGWPEIPLILAAICFGWWRRAKVPRSESVPVEVRRSLILAAVPASLGGLVAFIVVKQHTGLAHSGLLIPPEWAALGSVTVFSFLVAFALRLQRPLAKDDDTQGAPQ